MKFSDFLKLYEASASAGPQYAPLGKPRALEHIKKYCSDAMWMFENNKPLWRADGDGSLASILSVHGAATVDPSKTERKSQNTSNYYTVILDNNPAYSEFPKRSRSFIASTSHNTASDFAGGTNVLIPYDGVKIGVVGSTDLWDTQINPFGLPAEASLPIEDMNWFFNRLGIDDTMQSITAFGEKVDAGDLDALQKLEKSVGSVFDYISDTSTDEIVAYIRKRGFLKSVFDAYSPKMTGHKVVTTKTLKNVDGFSDTEVWVGGPCVILSNRTFHSMSDVINA